jgi:poly(3-hydroxybutyrate) depolymerase
MASVHRKLSIGSFVLGIFGCALASCSPADGSTSSGGSPSTGGVTGGNSATGGTVLTGGTFSTGGNASGGSPPQATGGSPTTGGSVTGGNPATGGTITGGNAATGGSSSGGSNAGGSSKGGSTTGGSAGGGLAGGGAMSSGGTTGGSATGGMSSGGATSGAGGASGGSQGKTSPGCGSSAPLKSGNFTESINGTNRKWILDVPTGYDANKPYRLIFVWHPLGGSGSQVASGGYNGLKSLSNNTVIFATADGLNGSNSEASGTGWWNVNGGDMKLVQTMLDKINAGLCVDQDRIFSTGFSFGGMMSYTLPFEFNVFRAVAPCSGKTGVIPYNEKYTNPVPIMAFHGDADTFVATNLGKAFFDKYASRNKCGTQSQAVSPNGCVQYQGCTVPSTWCLFPGGHTTWSEEPAAIWKFFSQF